VFHVDVSVDEQIAVVTLQKEPFNLGEQGFYGEIVQTMHALGKRNDYRVVILKSGCKHFCGGGDLNEISDILTKGGEFAEKASRACADAMASLMHFKKPIIAAVHGNAVGAGTAIAASCDIILAEEDTLFSVPEITVGFIGASEFMELLIPKRIARYYVLTGKPISARKVKDYGGILDTAKDKEELMGKAMSIAKDICRQAPTAVELFKKAMNDNDDECLKDKYLHEMHLAIDGFYTSRDAKEIAVALKEKRAPVFTGG
jgi:enoyl-CoA hydratase